MAQWNSARLSVRVERTGPIHQPWNRRTSAMLSRASALRC